MWSGRHARDDIQAENVRRDREVLPAFLGVDRVSVSCLALISLFPRRVESDADLCQNIFCLFPSPGTGPILASQPAPVTGFNTGNLPTGLSTFRHRLRAASWG